MIKRLSIVLVPLFFFAIVPVSLYASGNTDSVGTNEIGMNHEAHHQNSELTSNMSDAHEQHHQNSNMPISMMDIEFMNDMMNSIDCNNEEEHNTYIEEQIKYINAQLENNLITSDEANQRLAQLNEIQEFHQNNHQNMMDMTNSCHSTE